VRDDDPHGVPILHPGGTRACVGTRILARVQETTTETAPATVPVAATRAGLPRRVRLTFLVALVAFVGIGAGWALALPVNGTYDESEHIVRAYGVASGQIYATKGTQRVPASLLPGSVQCTWQRRLPASCQRPASADHHRVATRTGAAGYSPVYYLPVGLPMLVSPGYRGIVAGRLVSALLSGVLLAAAAAIAVWLGNRLLVCGLVLAATPMAMNLAGSINPNGLEIAAGVLLWCALLALLRPTATAPAGPDPGGGDGVPRVPAPRGPVRSPGTGGEPGTRALVLLAAVAAVLLMTVRHMGPVLLGMVLLTAAMLARPGRVRTLLRRRDVRVAGGVLVACGVLAVVWFLTSGVTDITPVPSRAHQYSLGHVLLLIMVMRVPFYLQQMVGQFSYGEAPIPSWAVIGWYVAVAALAVPALLVARRRYRVAMLGLLAACLAVLVVLEVEFIHTAGWVAHARYVMPAGVGVVLGACFVRRWQAALGPAAIGRLTGLALIVALLVHVWSLIAVMTRFQVGLGVPPDPLRGSWLPLGGRPLLALGALLVGLVALAALAWPAIRSPAAPPG
jgi:Predicted membrane protein (DUF2142)